MSRRFAPEPRFKSVDPSLDLCLSLWYWDYLTTNCSFRWTGGVDKSRGCSPFPVSASSLPLAAGVWVPHSDHTGCCSHPTSSLLHQDQSLHTYGQSFGIRVILFASRDAKESESLSVCKSLCKRVILFSSSQTLPNMHLLAVSNQWREMIHIELAQRDWIRKVISLEDGWKGDCLRNLYLGCARDRQVLSEGGVRAGLGKSAQPLGWRLPQETCSCEAGRLGDALGR